MHFISDLIPQALPFSTGKLVRFELEDFREFGKKAGINIKQLNILVGPNGSGKSTLMSAFRLMHKVVLNGNPLRIGLELVDEFNLVTKQKRPFFIRMYYDFVAFEYQYKVDDNCNWEVEKCRLSARDSGGAKNWLPAVQFTKGAEGVTFIKPGLKVLLSHALQLQSSKPKGLATTKRQIVSNMSNLFAEFNGAHSLSGVGHELSIGDSELYVLVRYQRAEAHDVVFTSEEGGTIAIKVDHPWYKQLRLIAGLSERVGRIDKNGFTVARVSEMYIDASSSSDKTKVWLEKFGLGDKVEASLNRVYFNTPRPNVKVQIPRNFMVSLANYILKLDGEMSDWATRLMWELEDDVVDFSPELRDYLAVASQGSSYIISACLGLFRGGKETEFGILPPAPRKPLDLEIKRLKESANIITIARESSFSEAVMNNVQIKRWLFERLGFFSQIVLEIPRAGLECKLALGPLGGIEVEVKKGGIRLPSQSLSRGEQKLLLIKLFVEFNAFLEEPEANLHPNYQSILGAMLAEQFSTVGNASVLPVLTSENTPDIVAIPSESEATNRRFLWVPNGTRDFMFIETHSDVMLKSIQLEMARHLPSKALWEENPGLTPSFQEVQRQFSEPDPNIEVTYFGTVNGKSVPKSMGLRRDGVFSEDWGPGFYDESLQLVRDIYDLKSQN